MDHLDSGNALLDSWLRAHTLHADHSGVGRTYVWVDDNSDVVLARSALRRPLHGAGLGGALLANALEIALEAIRTAGGRLIVVDTIDDTASPFHEHHGFLRVPRNPNRLVMRAGAAARSLSLPWP